MANNITGASLNSIYDRLHDVPEYHPLEADTFMDWSVEAGDVITVKRGDTEYSSPVQSTRIVWKGAPETTINSVGEKERESISRTSKKKYSRGSGALRNELYIYKEFTSSDGMLHSAIYMSESKLTTQFDNAISDVHSSILQTAEQIYSEVHASSSTLYSYVDQTATYISAAVENIESSLGSNIVQTAEQIYSEVHAANSTVYSYINQTATSISSRVEDVNSDLHSEILQTQSMIRSAVWTANSIVYSYVDQTASYILDHVGERSGSKVIPSMTQPEDSPDNPLNVGDLWVEGAMINFWEDFDDQTSWIDYDPTHPEYDWSQLKGQKLYIWKDGEWQLVHDETTLAEDTDLVRTKESISLIAYNTKYLNDEFKSNVARLDVKADRITAEVKEQVDGVNSTITQTATQIRQEVSNTTSQLQSSIQVEADKISLVVESTAQGNKIKPAQIVAAINDGASSILISADHVNLDGYVKATDITADYIKGKIASISSVSMQSLVASNIQFSVGGGLYGNPTNAIMNLQLYQSGNSYQIWGAKFNGDIVKTSSFSRAVSSWDWTGGNGQVKVTAQPQNQTLGVDVRVNGDATITSNGTYTYKAQYEDNNGSYWDIGGEGTKTITVNVPQTSYYSRTMRCTGKESTYPGSTTYRYTFTLEGSYSFSTGSNYTFYRTSW